jgi:hypothetical protein
MHFKITIVLFIFLVSCGNVQENTDNNTESEPVSRETIYMEKGKEIAANTGIILRNRVSRAIDEQGIIKAVQYCSIEAENISDSLSAVYNARIKRISDKPRNPDNAASEYELQLMNDFRNLMASGGEFSPALFEEENRMTFYAPITINTPLCLNCHGERGTDIRPEAFITIQLLYPKDKATGYKMGDLRGLWKIVFEDEIVARIQ